MADKGIESDGPGDKFVIHTRGNVELKTDPAYGQDWNPERYKAETARYLARGLLYIFAVSVIMAVAVGIVYEPQDGIDMAQVILPFTGAPLAVTVGYFFGASK